MDEQTRQRVFARLREVIGEEAATTLMSGVPPFDWSEVATKSDLALLATQLREEMSTLGTELRAEMSSLRTELRGEISSLRTEMRGEMAELRVEMGGLRGEMGQVEARLATAMAAQTRYYMVTTVGAVLTTGALAFAAAGLT